MLSVELGVGLSIGLSVELSADCSVLSVVVVVVLSPTRKISSPWSQNRLQSLWSGRISHRKKTNQTS